MRARPDQALPPARRDQLIIQELPDELLVYDLDRHTAHCLNQTCSFVWKHCDGKTSLEEMTRLLERKFAASIDEDIVWLALSQLRKFHLLEERSGTDVGRKVSRRDLVGKYLPAALALPLILSVSAPTAAQAASGCLPIGSACTSVAQCCPAPGIGCCGTCKTNC